VVPAFGIQNLPATHAVLLSSVYLIPLDVSLSLSLCLAQTLLNICRLLLLLLLQVLLL
jgi:hypothetical protein